MSKPDMAALSRKIAQRYPKTHTVLAEAETRDLYADRPSRRLRALAQRPDGLIPVCPRCNEDATGQPGRWWCSECSAPVTTPRRHN